MSGAHELAAAIESLAGEPVRQIVVVAGGDVATAHRVELSSGRRLFAKVQPAEPRGALASEAEGLEWLREAGALRIPEVIGADVTASMQVLVLEWINVGAPRPDHDEWLGRGLAKLHQAEAPHFGLQRDNFIAALSQPNAAADDWASFYRTQRLDPMLVRAQRAGYVDRALQRRFDRLAPRLGELLGPPEPPARLHGDLWAGNLLHDSTGRPVLIDPAAYGGHCEIDLAMMMLFGGFSDRVFSAYHEAFPLEPGWRERVPLHQLYPLLVHVNLFGASYLGPLQSTIDRYL